MTTFDQLIPGAFLNTRRFARAHPDLPVPKPLATRPLERQMVEALITLCPNPYDILKLGQKGIIDLFHEHSYRCGPKTADKILSVVRRSLLPPSDVAPAFATILQREFEHYQLLASQQQKGIDNLELLLPTTSARHLLPIPGTSPHLVARYLTGVGNVDDVLFADQVWAKAGMNPSVYISGDVIVYGEMSKQGNTPSTSWATTSPFTVPTLATLSSTPLSAARARSRPPSTPLTRSTGSLFIS
jgi:hypothetical protein